tara:strand:+ start:2355 stop:3191 length:837 start_codon:yes stop_codon:yes gene_type:complete
MPVSKPASSAHFHSPKHSDNPIYGGRIPAPPSGARPDMHQRNFSRIPDTDTSTDLEGADGLSGRAFGALQDTLSERTLTVVMLHRQNLLKLDRCSSVPEGRGVLPEVNPKTFTKDTLKNEWVEVSQREVLRFLSEQAMKNKTYSQGVTETITEANKLRKDIIKKFDIVHRSAHKIIVVINSNADYPLDRFIQILALGSNTHINKEPWEYLIKIPVMTPSGLLERFADILRLIPLYPDLKRCQKIFVNHNDMWIRGDDDGFIKDMIESDAPWGGDLQRR